MSSAWKRSIGGAALLGIASCGGQPAEPEAAAPPVTKRPVGASLDGFDFRGPNGTEASWSAAAGLQSGDGRRSAPAALFVHVFQPDCPACMNHARELERFRTDRDEGAVGIVGIAHKQGDDEVVGFARATAVAYPLVVATGSEWASRWGRGDPMLVVDRAGRIVYAQVGFHPSDSALWKQVADDLAAGRAPRVAGPSRQVLQDGERFPRVALPDLATSRPMLLATDDAGELFVEQDGRRRPWRAAVGFFTRY